MHIVCHSHIRELLCVAIALPYCPSQGHFAVRQGRACYHSSSSLRRLGSLILNLNACAQNSWDRSKPLIVHAASSTSNPYSHFSIYKEVVYPYWSENPAKFRFNFGGYQKCDPSLTFVTKLPVPVPEASRKPRRICRVSLLLFNVFRALLEEVLSLLLRAGIAGMSATPYVVLHALCSFLTASPRGIS